MSVRVVGDYAVEGARCNEICDVVTTAAERLRVELTPCGDCGRVGVHAVGCSEVREMVDMASTSMMTREEDNDDA